VLRLLQARGRFGIRLGLSRTRALLRELGDPHRRLRGVLIGGTNGKGSVQALVGAALLGAGRRVGQTPKPHLASYRERLMVDGQPIGVEDFCSLIERVSMAAAPVERRHGALTEFELLTAAAFSWFAECRVEVGVVEVGMGGRLDATNVWQGGVTAITNVGLDHTEHLGPTTVAIAREKAQIIKRGDHAALTGAAGEALAVIRRRARAVGVPLDVVEPLVVLGMDLEGVILAPPSGVPLRVGLLGRHQAANAALALAILDRLAAAGIARADEATVRKAFAAARWPGRLELVRPPAGGPVLFDGAHNADGMHALAEALDELLPLLGGGAPTVVIGVLADKDLRAMLAGMCAARSLDGARFIATRVPDSPRARPAAELAAEIAVRWPARPAAIDDPAAALEQARQSAGPVIVCGSLYLVGHLRQQLLSEVED